MTTIHAREENSLLSDLQEGDSIIFKSCTCTHNHTRRHEYEPHITTVWSYEEAIAWWLTTTFGMPNTKPAITSPELIDDFFTQGQDLPGYRYMHFGARDDNIQACDEALAHPKIVSVKIYPAEKNDDGTSKVVTTSFAWTKAEVFDHSPEPGHTLDKIARLCIKHNKPLIIHCETPGMWHIPIAEEHYIDHTVLPLCKRLPTLKFVVAHTTLLSTAQKVIACNRDHGTNIYMELTPHHLWFNEDDIQDNFLECFPRIRSEANRQWLLKLLATIGEDPHCKIMHGTDHAPHTKEAKEKGSRGIPNFRDTIPMILTLAEQENMTTTQLQLFLRWMAEQCYPFLTQEEDMFTAISKTSYTPPADYYNGSVKNPLHGTTLPRKILL